MVPLIMTPPAELLEGSETRQLRKGELLNESNEPVQPVFWLVEGYVRVYSIRGSGERNLHIMHRPGELFPLDGRRNVPDPEAPELYFEAMCPVTVTTLAAERLQELVETDLATANYVARQLVDRLQVYTGRVENLEVARAADKVVYRLLALMRRFGRTAADGSVLIEAPVTQQDIADSLNMIRETASREIERLAARGIVGYRDRRLVILRPHTLRDERESNF